EGDGAADRALDRRGVTARCTSQVDDRAGQRTDRRPERPQHAADAVVDEMPGAPLPREVVVDDDVRLTPPPLQRKMQGIVGDVTEPTAPPQRPLQARAGQDEGGEQPPRPSPLAGVQPPERIPEPVLGLAHDVLDVRATDPRAEIPQRVHREADRTAQLPWVRPERAEGLQQIEQWQDADSPLRHFRAPLADL